MVYKAPLDLLAKLVTVSVTLLFAASIFQLISSYSSSKNIVDLLSVALILCIYFSVYLFRPVRYVVGPDLLIIHRPIRNITIRRADIVSVEKIISSPGPMGYRLFGVGGLFGYFGRFVFYDIGTVNLYSTNRINQVLIRVGGRQKIVLSPEDPAGFIRQIAPETKTA